MRKILLLAVTCCFVSFLHAQGTQDEQQIKKAITQSFDTLWSAAREKKIADYYTKDFLLLEDGMVWNLDSVRHYLSSMLSSIEAMQKQGQKLKRINRFEFIQASVLNDMAWVAYHNKAAFKIDDKITGEMHWLESAALIKTPNGWRIQLLHSTPISPVKEK